MYESGENYLETILRLREKNGTVRSIDIAHELNFSKPKEDGFLVVGARGDIELTKEGLEKAESVYERHKLLTAFLQKVAGVGRKAAEEDACRMEHIISEEVFLGIKRFMSEQSL